MDENTNVEIPVEEVPQVFENTSPIEEPEIVVTPNIIE